jgi:hypothetical protein
LSIFRDEQGTASPQIARTVSPAELTTDHLRALVSDDHRSLRSIAAEFGVGRESEEAEQPVKRPPEPGL